MNRWLAGLAKKPATTATIACLLLCGCWFGSRFVLVFLNESQPMDCVLVLGGDPSREVFAAALVKRNANLNVIVSGGSPAVHVRKIFVAADVSLNRVILDRSAKSTFENFLYSLPLLKRVQAHKVGIVTSEGNQERALSMARILLWFNGMSVQNEVLPFAFAEQGHNESTWKTCLDIVRALLYAPISTLYCPEGKTEELKSVDPNLKWNDAWGWVPPTLQRDYDDFLAGRLPTKTD